MISWTGMADTYRAGRNLLTTHGPADYPGLLVVKPGADWDVFVSERAV